MPETIYSTLKKYYGYEFFRESQEEAIFSIISGRDTFLILPTGGGKSVCYQIPAILLEGITLVISPLIALMQDQVNALNDKNIPSAFINSSQSEQEIAHIFQLASKGHLKLLYIAPERLQSKEFLELLTKININFIAIDEAHCISEWGHDFRPQYQQIPKVFEYIKRVPIIALTATATPEVQDDIILNLGLIDPFIIVKGFARENLQYITEKTEDKYKRLVSELNDLNGGSAIVYCGSRKQSVQTYELLIKEKLKPEIYHGGLNSLIRKSVQNRFINDKSKIIVATNAFGMGIDKPDVRKVIHLGITPSLEAYYQEAGRAGRDGKPSKCILLYDDKDYKLQEFFIEQTFPDKTDIYRLFRYFKDESYWNKSESTFGVEFDEYEVANKLQVPVNKLKPALNILERYKAIQINSSNGYWQVRLTASRDRFVEYIGNQQGNNKLATEAILRSLTADAFSQSVNFDISEISRKHNVRTEDLAVSLKSLNFNGMAEVIQPSMLSRIFLRIKDIDEIYQVIDLEAMHKRKLHSEQKLRAMRNYAETKECKSNYILKYFREPILNNGCGKCSSCKIF